MDRFIVTEKCGMLRALGREVLKGKWKLAFIAVLVYNAAISIPAIILAELFRNAPGISSIYSLLVAGPFYLGYSIFALSVFRNEDAKIGQIFYGFERFGKSFRLALLIALYVFLWYLLMIPGIVLTMYRIFFAPLLILLACPVFIALIKYSQSFYILADHPEIGVFECVNRSKRMMAGNKKKFALLYLSFSGWAILAAIPPAVFAVIGITSNKAIMSEFSSMNSIQAYQNFDPTQVFPVGITLLMVVSSVGMVLLQTYMMAALTAFYDIASGNLRPGYIASTAEVISGN